MQIYDVYLSAKQKPSQADQLIRQFIIKIWSGRLIRFICETRFKNKGESYLYKYAFSDKFYRYVKSTNIICSVYNMNRINRMNSFSEHN